MIQYGIPWKISETSRQTTFLLTSGDLYSFCSNERAMKLLQVSNEQMQKEVNGGVLKRKKLLQNTTENESAGHIILLILRSKQIKSDRSDYSAFLSHLVIRFHGLLVSSSHNESQIIIYIYLYISIYIHI